MSEWVAHLTGGQMDGRMDGWMDGRMDGWMDGWTDRTDGRIGRTAGCTGEQMDGWMDGWMDAWMDGSNGWMDGRMDRWSDLWAYGWTDGRMDGRMDRWADGQMDRRSLHPSIHPSSKIPARPCCRGRRAKQTVLPGDSDCQICKNGENIPPRFRQSAWAAGHAPAHAETSARKEYALPGTFSD